MKNKVLSLILTLALLLGFIPNLSMAYSENNSEYSNVVEIKSNETTEIDGQIYKVFEINNLKVNNLLKSARSYGEFKPMAAGDNLLNWQLQVDWIGRGESEFPFPSGGMEVTLIKGGTDTVYGKVVYPKDKIDTETGIGTPIPFLEVENVNPDELGDSVLLGIPDSVIYDSKVFLEGTPKKGYKITAAFKQKVNPLFKSEWHIKDADKPLIDAYVIDTNDDTKSMDFYAPEDDNEIYSIYDNQMTQYYDGTSLKPVVTGANARKSKNKDYRGAFGEDSIVLGNAADPSIEFGYGESDNKNNTGFKNVNNKKYLLNVFGDHLTIKRYAVYEALEVKFNTGNGKLTADGETNQDIGNSQEIGYSEKIANNESGRTITLPTDKLIPPAAKAGEPANEFKGWALSKDATNPLFKTQGQANAYAEPFTEDVTTFYAVFGPVAQGKVAIQYVDVNNNGNAIADDYKISTEKYPKNVEGNVGEPVDVNKIPEPKFIGYKRVEGEAGKIDVSGKTYKEDRIETVEVKYEKLDEIVEKKPGTTIPDGYVDITFTNAKDGNKTVSKFDAQTDAADIVYSINPKAGVKIQKDSTTNKYQLVGKNAQKQPLKKDVPVVNADNGYKAVDHQESGAATGWNYDNYDLVNQALTEAKTFTAQVEQKGNGTAKLAYVDENNAALDPVNNQKLQIANETYNPSLSGKEGTALPSYTAQNAPKLLGYVFVAEASKKANNADVTEYKEGQEAVITLKYKKLDDIIKPSTPNDEKPAGYITVKFLSDDEDVQDPRGKLWLKDATQTEAPTDDSKLFTELVYYVNPKNATLDLEANKLSGKKANGTDEINVEVYAKVTDGKSKVKLNDSNKYDWDKNPADAIDNNKKVKKDVTLTVQYKALTIADIITKANLAPVTLKVWVGDTIPWKDGVKVADTVTDNALKTKIEGYLNDANTSYKDNSNPARNSDEEAVSNPKTGTIRVTFSDNSFIDVENQDLYVIPHVISSTNDKAPKDAIEVTFMLGEGVKAGTKTGAATPVEYAKYKVKPNTNLDTYELKIAGTKATIFQHINAEVTNPTEYKGVVWVGQTANKPKDHMVTDINKVFTAKAAKIFTVNHVFKGIDADKDDRPEIAANDLPEELKAGANSLIPADKILEEKKSYTPSNIDTKVTQTIKNAQDEVTMVYEWTFKEWKPNKIENISKTKTVTGIWERRQATSDKPTVDQPKAEDTVIKGKGKKGSTIVVTTPDGKTHKTTVGDNGDWSVTVPPVKENDKIKVTQEEKGKKPSDPVDVTVERKIKYFGHFYEPSPDYLNKNVPAKKEEKVQEKYLEAYRWYVKGNDMGMFMPKKGITRAEVAQMFARALEYDKAMVNVNITPYTDVDANAWYYEAVQKTSAAGIFKGSDKGTFMPTREITKAELIATIARFQHLSTKAGNTLNLQANHWATPEVEAAYQEGWLDIYTNGTAQFRADEVISREEVVTILNRAFGRIADTKYIDDNAHTMTNFPDVTKDMWSYYEIMTAANHI